MLDLEEVLLRIVELAKAGQEIPPDLAAQFEELFPAGRVRRERSTRFVIRGLRLRPDRIPTAEMLREVLASTLLDAATPTFPAGGPCATRFVIRKPGRAK